MMHYHTMEKVHGINNENHTANSIPTNGSLRSCCWQLVRQSMGDEGYFGNCIKMEVTPVVIPYNKDIKNVFLNQNDINDIMCKYSVFVKFVIGTTVHKVHLYLKTIATKVENMMYGKSNFGNNIGHALPYHGRGAWNQ